ncbi:MULTISPECIES: flagellar basal body rod protein FlgB [Gammaproteobacteria]|uniref:flagellar basal body rod protein FlgB n=1 Tax=Gammaproteobacteria TaxID=1236 RepID=UPI000DCF6718|nr:MULTISPECIES: flagellar basal body rod protein FlgB [Gammaproteobacteria]RTE86165.1 flagellar basal body rod protein FlgB [Aliidiomarina sp. B3213]TCZ91516.1 flagellar basal body rod protein FlgB [Lysobacter sp. N42]
MSINMNNALGIHPDALLVRERRAEVLASNIANADTPGYKARDIDFRTALANAQQRQDFSLNQTHERHFTVTLRSPEGEKFRVPNQPDTGDGNTVDVQVERNLYLRNALEYQASLEFLNSRVSGVKKALGGQ